MKLGGDNAFQGFREERQVGDRKVAGEVGWIKGGLFEDGGDGGSFVDRGNKTKGWRLIEEGGEMPDEDGEAGLG